MTVKNFNVPLLDMKKKPTFETLEDGTKEPVTLCDQICNALLANHVADQDIKRSVKLERYNLALKVMNAKPEGEDYTANEIGMIDACVSRGYGPLVLGQIAAILDS